MRKPDPRKTAAKLSRICSLRPALALVLGSGFDEFSLQIRPVAEISRADLPGFPTSAVAGHSGRVIWAIYEEIPVLLLCGRAHYYEGYSMEEVTFPIRVLAEYGVRMVLLTNAAGGINPRFRPGDFMCLTDHINLMGANPLRGKCGWDGSGFADMTQMYDPEMNGWLRTGGRKAKARMHEGVYVAVSGPSYETPAEIRAFGILGADAVGMSTVPEAVVARQRGLRVAGLSCITNLAAGRNARPLTHAEVLQAGRQAAERAAMILGAFIRNSAST